MLGNFARSLLIVSLVVTHGCATFQEPISIEESGLLDWAQTREDGNLRVTVAVSSDEESLSLFGVPLAKKGIQPVFVEIYNGNDKPFWFLIPGLDRAFYSPNEVAYSFRTGDDETDVRIRDHFHRMSFKNPIEPGETKSGFVFANHDDGVKVVDVDVVSGHEARFFSFLATVPGLKTDAAHVDFDPAYGPNEWIDIDDENTLRTALEQLPCCTTDKAGDSNGDPLNIVLIGRKTDIFSAFVRRGWSPTEVIYPASAWKTFKSYVFGTHYRYSPISPLYVFGRPQDFSVQQARGTIHNRNHIRLWQTPLRFRGQAVFIGQISRDIGVKYTSKSKTLTTHEIDPDVDETRELLIQDLTYSLNLARFGFIDGVGEVPRDQPHYNLTDSPYYTDGRRAVLFFVDHPVSISDIEVLNWD